MKYSFYIVLFLFAGCAPYKIPVTVTSAELVRSLEPDEGVIIGRISVLKDGEPFAEGSRKGCKAYFGVLPVSEASTAGKIDRFLKDKNTTSSQLFNNGFFIQKTKYRQGTIIVACSQSIPHKRYMLFTNLTFKTMPATKTYIGDIVLNFNYKFMSADQTEYHIQNNADSAFREYSQFVENDKLPTNINLVTMAKPRK